MAIRQVRALINSVWTVLTFNAETGKYQGTIAAPSVTSYNVNAGHYYPVSIEATNMAGTVKTVDDTDATVGNSLKLRVKETTKPTITITAPTAGQFLGNNKPSITVQVRDEAGGSGINLSTLSIKIDNTTYQQSSDGVTITSATNGHNITLVPPTALSDGSHTVKVNVSDNDGNAAVEVSRSFTTDTVPPVLSVTNPANNDIWVAVAAYNLTGTTSDSTSGTPIITVKLNNTDQGSVTVSAQGTFTKALTLVEGSNTIEVKATDKAGKITTVSRTIKLDTTTPTIQNVVITPNPVNVGSSYLVEVTVNG